MLMSIIAVMTITMSKADDKPTMTPNQFVTNIAEVPAKVSVWFTSEVEKTKEYQKNSFAEAKKKWPWNKIFKGDNE